VVALFALCTAPVLFLERLNGRYVLLAVFMAFYFLFFGMLDSIALIFGTTQMLVQPGGAEWALLVGATCTLVGYLLTSRIARNAPRRPADDWPQNVILVVGLLLWTVGSASQTYFLVYVMPDSTSITAARAFTALGPTLTFAFMLGSLVAPLGLLILACGYAKFRTLPWLLLIAVVLVVQVAMAFVGNSRGLALMPPVVVIMAVAIKDSRLPKTWIVACLFLFPLAFQFVSAYRAEITSERGLSRTQAVNNLSHVIDVVVASVERTHRPGERASIFERASLKDNFDLEYARTGVDRPFQNGRTLLAIPLAFIPRMVLPDKPDVETGRLFNHQFYGGTDDTYISPSHLGELYWNFGWPGLVAGMLLIGMLLGFVGARTDLSERFSVTRVLVLLVTVQYLCWGSEGDMQSYVSWIRSIAVIGLLHLMFARLAREPALTAMPDSDARMSGGGPPLRLSRFPNILT
jgi:hypothetical protein